MIGANRAWLFGDGALVRSCSASEQTGICLRICTAKWRRSPTCCSIQPVRHAAPRRVSRSKRHRHMQGAEVFKEAVGSWRESFEETLAENGLDRSDIDWLVPHKRTAPDSGDCEETAFSDERVNRYRCEHGQIPRKRPVRSHSTSGFAMGRIRPRDLLMLEAFGGGFTWGSALTCAYE